MSKFGLKFQTLIFPTLLWLGGVCPTSPPLSPKSRIRTNRRNERREAVVERRDSNSVLKFSFKVKSGSRSSQKSKLILFALSAVETILETAANPNSAEVLLRGWWRCHIIVGLMLSRSGSRSWSRDKNIARVSCDPCITGHLGCRFLWSHSFSRLIKVLAKAS